MMKCLSYLFVAMFIFSSTFAFGENNNHPWLLLLLNDDQQGETKQITNVGGILKFRNGVTLDIPAGAVSEPTSITVKNVPCDKVNPILWLRKFASHEKRCIGGFSAEPDGFVFNTPIKATVPVLSLNPGEFPVQIEANLDTQRYWITKTDLVYWGTTESIDLTIQHFSDYWLAVLGNHIDKVCSHCETWNDPEFIPICASLDLLQPNCCLLKPAERTKCAPACQCCKEIKSIVRSAGIDASYGNCQIVEGETEVTYPYCPGSPTETYSISEISADCPENMCAKIAGSWSGSWSEVSCDGLPYSGSWAGKVTTDCIFKGTGAWDHKRGTINPFTLVLTSSGISEDGCGIFSLTGVFPSNNSLSGNYTYNAGGGGSFAGHK